MTEYRIDDLAREADTTVRNIRAYQDRGLLPPPRREGRVGLYSEAHLGRLRVIQQLLDRGYSLANIAELVGAWQQGRNVAELLGFEAALTDSWTTEVESTISPEQLSALFGDQVPPGALEDAVRLGILEQSDDGFRVLRPRLLEAGAELAQAGVPLEEILDLAVALRRDMDRVARRFVDLVAEHVFDPLGDPLPTEDLPRLTDLVRRLRPLAGKAVGAELALAVQRRVQQQLDERLGRILGRERDAAAGG
ncbi:MAG: MerR family transcriptional regulator [Actinomycetota bacterium]|nr:MerR family transcriptional regulator [Actinomycetota bacterium]